MANWQGKVVVWSILLLVVTACTQDQTVALERRVQEYWQAYQMNDLAAQYQLESGSLPGGGLSASDYAKRSKKNRAIVRYLNVRISDMEVKGAEAEVNLLADMRFERWGVVEENQRLQQKWVMIDGQWYQATKGGGSISETLQQSILGSKSVTKEANEQPEQPSAESPPAR